MLSRKTHGALTTFAAGFLLLTACGGGGGGGGGDSPAPTPPPPPPAAQLVSISVSPGNPAIPLGTTQQFVATGTYSDSTSLGVTTLVSWSSSTASVAQVNDQASKGLASSLAVGTTTITATLNGINGTAQLTIDPAALVSIEVLPAPNVLPPSTSQIAIAAELQFAAAGHYTDNTTQNITDSVTWSSSNTMVAAIGNTPSERGIATGMSEGAVTLDATLGSITATAGLTVIPVRALDFAIPNSKNAGPGLVEIDGNGNALAVWNYWPIGANSGGPPEINTASYTPAGGWSPKTLIDFGTISDFPATPVLAMNASGAALLAWTGHGGVYASKYTPASGWQQARVIASGNSPFITFAGNLRIAIDSGGDGLLVWVKDENGNKLFSSQYLQSADTWTAPMELPGGDMGAAGSAPSLAMNAGGAAVLLWESWDSVWTINASMFVPGTGQGTGWQPPLPLYQSTSWHTPTVAINDVGEVIATWVDYITDFPNTSLYAERFIPANGWQALEGIAVNNAGRPADPALAMNGAGAAVVVWRNAFDSAVRASRFVAGNGWQAPETLWPTGVGGPRVLQPHIAPDGRILAAWVVEDLRAPFKVGLRRYVPGTGWEAARGLPYIKHKGLFSATSGIDIAFNASGTGVALWEESYDVFNGALSFGFSDLYANTQLTY